MLDTQHQADRGLVLPPGVEIGPGYSIGPNVIVGQPTGRQLDDRSLSIGPGAVLRSGTVIYHGSVIGARLETGHNVVIREQNRLGEQVSIWNNTTIDYGCTIGNRVKLHTNVYVAQFTVLEDDVFLAPGVTIANDQYPGDPESARVMRGPHLERGAQIGVNATILPYVRIGAGSLVGAGSVVTKSVPPGVVVVGNPARIVRKVSELRSLAGLTEKPHLEQPE